MTPTQGAPTQGDGYEKFEGTEQPVTPDEVAAEFFLFGDVKVADNEESQEFFGEVERLNPAWQPGDVPHLPAGCRSGAAFRAALAGLARPVTVETRPRDQRSGRPREQRSGRGRSRRGPPSSDDPDPEPAASPFQAAWRNALYLTAGELDALVSHARIRIASLMRGRAV